MKMKWIALASLLATQAYAQSSVTAYGVMDVGFVKGSGDVASWSGLASGRNMSSRLGFKGEEDLGGGLKANFILEADLAGDTGTGAWIVTAGPMVNLSGVDATPVVPPAIVLVRQ